MQSQLDYFIGTYTDEIIWCQLDESTGAITIVGAAVTGGVMKPSWLAMWNGAVEKYLYAVNEVSDFEGTYTGSITSFRLGNDLSLTYLNRS